MHVRTVTHEQNAHILTNTQNNHRIRFRITKSNEPQNGKTKI